MKTFLEAQTIVFSSAAPPGKESVPLKDALGRVLAEPLLADSDLPPFSRSAMDGYACRKADLNEPLEVIETIPAGSDPEKSIGKGECSKIMTGAKIPEGCDMVIRIEDTELNDEGKVIVRVKGVNSNIRYRGEDLKKGSEILKAGIQINKQHIGILAMSGKINPVVYQLPSVGIIATGAELVPPESVQEKSRIRNSNGPQLTAQVSAMGLPAEDFGIATDDRERIRNLVYEGLKRHRIVLISGGVSAGDYDFVPDILAGIGMEIRFHKMKVRPGKPLLFAVRDDQYVFGIPGNPVSTFVQFECLIKPFLRKLMGIGEFEKRYAMFSGEDYQHVESELQYFLPVRITEDGVLTLTYHGSGHLVSYAGADGILEIPPGKTFIRKGERVFVRLI